MDTPLKDSMPQPEEQLEAIRSMLSAGHHEAGH